MFFLKIMWHILYLKAISMNGSDACSSRLSKTTHTVNTKLFNISRIVTGTRTHTSRENIFFSFSLWNVRLGFSCFLVWATDKTQMAPA